MAKVNGTFYTAQRLRRDTTPVSPPLDGEEGQPFPINPPGTRNRTSYLSLTDTDDTSYTDKLDFVPHVNETETGLILKRINKNVDGGFANSVYLQVQQVDGGTATT